MPHTTSAFFNSLIAARSLAGRAEEAFSTFTRMMAAGLRPTPFTFGPILSSSSLDLLHGKQLHSPILKSGLLHADPYSGTALLGFFGRNGRPEDALKLFDEMPVKSVVTWNSLISSFARMGFAEDSVLLFRELLRADTTLSECSILSALSAFNSSDSIGSVRQVHGLVIRTAMHLVLVVANSLLNVYCCCSEVHVAEQLFDELLVRDVVSWNTMIAALANRGTPERAVQFFLVMQLEGTCPNERTFSGVLNACSALKETWCGKLIHAKAIKRHLDISVFVGSSLVDFYAKHASRTNAYRMFSEIRDKNIVSWNALFSCYSNEDMPTRLVLLKEILHSGIRPNEVSFSSALKDASPYDILQLHSLVIRMGYDSHEYVSSAITASYASHGVVFDALACGIGLDLQGSDIVTNIIAGVFNKAGLYQETKALLSNKQALDAVSWSMLFTACAHNGDYMEAFWLFKQMQASGILLDKYMAVSLLSICSKISSLIHGKLLHGILIKAHSGCLDTFVQNVLLDMYAKCGSIEDCLKVLGEIEDRNLISWTAAISGLGLHGRPSEALKFFKQMREDGFQPDHAACLSVLSACRHGGFVEEGMLLFKQMKAGYRIEPEIGHYICVVDLLCKHGQIKEAELVISSMPFQPNAVILRSFLQGCMRYKEIAAQRKFSVSYGDIMSNISVFLKTGEIKLRSFS